MTLDEWRVRHAMRRLMARLDRFIAQLRPRQVAALTRIIGGPDQ
jgi:hypothetical protein